MISYQSLLYSTIVLYDYSQVNRNLCTSIVHVINQMCVHCYRLWVLLTHSKVLLRIRIQSHLPYLMTRIERYYYIHSNILYRMGGNFRGVKISCYFEEAIILNFRGC